MMVTLVRCYHVKITHVLHARRRVLQDRRTEMGPKHGGARKWRTTLFNRKEAEMRLQQHVLHAAHGFVRCVKHGNFIYVGEACRILLNFAKVTGHLYAGLAHCLEWPDAMEAVIKVATALSFDFLTELRVPCMVEGKFNYFFKVRLAILVPALPFVFVFIASIGVIIAYAIARRCVPGESGAQSC